jgi:uncharacterized protein YndB with AHSA1/START domain
MTVTSVEKDYENLQMILTADFTAPIEQVWELWADPRKLERWWGPPTYPATFIEHDLTPGSIVNYYMTSPEGEKHYGWWRINSVSPPSAIEFNDGFGEQPTEGMPVGEMKLELVTTETGTRMILSSRNSTPEDFNMVLEMGMEEGITASVGQMDALLAES